MEKKCLIVSKGKNNNEMVLKSYTTIDLFNILINKLLNI